jgi:hypothetical protein
MADSDTGGRGSQITFWQAPDGKESMARRIAWVGFIAGLVLLVLGIAIVIWKVMAVDKDLAGVGKDIVVAGLGVFTAAGLTKAGNGIAEAIRFKGR